jgi:hypothetical protein
MWKILKGINKNLLYVILFFLQVNFYSEEGLIR